MDIPLPTRDLNQKSLADARALFVSLPPPDRSQVTGVYQAAFVGPAWVRALAKPALRLTGLGGWWGKVFDEGGQGMNIVQRRGRLQRILPIRLAEVTSLVDGRPGLGALYPADARPPWPWIMDELRRLDTGLMLGMVMIRRGPLSRFAFPFVLQQRESVDGL